MCIQYLTLLCYHCTSIDYSVYSEWSTLYFECTCTTQFYMYTCTCTPYHYAIYQCKGNSHITIITVLSSTTCIILCRSMHMYMYSWLSPYYIASNNHFAWFWSAIIIAMANYCLTAILHYNIIYMYSDAVEKCYMYNT